MAVSMHWNYDQLKRTAAGKCTSYDLSQLREVFASEISTRKIDVIGSIEDLIDVLERRDEISEERISPFHIIANHCNNTELQAALNAYPVINSTSAPVNQYQELRLAEELQLQLHINPASTPVAATASSASIQQGYVTPASFTERKRATIFKKLSEELGRSWRDMGRCLDINEAALYEIELRYPQDVKSRILRVLQLFEEDECHDPRQRLLILCRALSECGRKDLRRKVESIMSFQ